MTDLGAIEFAQAVDLGTVEFAQAVDLGVANLAQAVDLGTVETNLQDTPSGSATYYDEVVAQLGAANIVAHFEANESSGTAAVDAGPNGYDGTLENGVTLGATSLLTQGGGTCWDFDGVNDYVDLGPRARWNYVHQTGIFTVSAWAVVDSVTGGLRGVLGNTSAANSYGHFIFLNYSASLLRYGLYVNPAEYTIDAAIPADGAHFFALTGDGSTLRAYVDAVEVGSMAFTPEGSPGSDSTQAPSIGRMGASFLCDGRIDGVTYASAPATLAQIQALYAYGTA